MPYFQIKLQAAADDYPPVVDVASFLYDFNFLYELFRLGTDPEYAQYQFSEDTRSRQHRPLIADQQLHVVTLRQESPLMLVAAVAAIPSAIGAILGLLQIIEKIANWPVNREMLKLQRDKLRADLKKMEIPDPTSTEDHEPSEKLQLREGQFLIDDVLRRLNSGRIRISDFRIDLVRQLPRKHQNRDSASE